MGTKSVEEALREPTLRAAARAFARGLNAELLLGVAVPPVAALAVAGDDGPDPLRSEAAESVLGPMGTVRFWRF